jgi:flagellar motor switch protein FliG
VKDALPDVEYIISQRQKFEKAIADYQKGAIKPEDFDRISKEMSELEDLVKRSESSFQSVVTAVDPENLSVSQQRLFPI